MRIVLSMEDLERLTISISLAGENRERFEAAFAELEGKTLPPAKLTRHAFCLHLVMVGLAAAEESSHE